MNTYYVLVHEGRPDRHIVAMDTTGTTYPLGTIVVLQSRGAIVLGTVVEKPR